MKAVMRFGSIETVLRTCGFLSLVSYFKTIEN